jgi:hypothetical protein
MNIDKKILICANKFKTAKDILSRIKMAYEMLPNWMKPRHNHLECFRNRILKPVAKSQQKPHQNLQDVAGSINCLSGDETINILFNNESYTLPLKRAYDIFKIEKMDEIIKNDDTVYINI